VFGGVGATAWAAVSGFAGCRMGSMQGWAALQAASRAATVAVTTLEDVCLDLLIVRKHVYNQYNCNRSFKAEVEFLEEIQTEVLRVFLLAIHRHLY